VSVLRFEGDIAANVQRRVSSGCYASLPQRIHPKLILLDFTKVGYINSKWNYAGDSFVDGRFYAHAQNGFRVRPYRHTSPRLFTVAGITKYAGLSSHPDRSRWRPLVALIETASVSRRLFPICVPGLIAAISLTWPNHAWRSVIKSHS